MKRFILIFFILLSFFILSSCKKETPYKLYKAGKYQESYDLLSSNDLGKIDEVTLYLKAANLYNLHRYKEARNSAELYYYLFNKDKAHRESILRILLFTDSSELGILSGKELYEMKELTKEGMMQYYKLLNDNGRFTEAETFLSSVSSSLSDNEAFFTIINGNAQSIKLVTTLDEVFNREGLSSNFINLVSLSIPTLIVRGDEDYILPLINRTYSFNPHYALVIGDLYFSLNDYDMAEKYWREASSEFSDGVAERLEIIGELNG